MLLNSKFITVLENSKMCQGIGRIPRKCKQVRWDQTDGEVRAKFKTYFLKRAAKFFLKMGVPTQVFHRWSSGLRNRGSAPGTSLLPGEWEAATLICRSHGPCSLLPRRSREGSPATDGAPLSEKGSLVGTRTRHPGVSSLGDINSPAKVHNSVN